jgi:hypothetical protein
MAPTIQGNESMSNATERADARILHETTNRRAILRGILAGSVAAATALPATGASASPAQSEALRLAIAGHRAAQAKVDGMVTPSDPLAQDDYEDAFAAACHVAEAALWEVAETPCSNDADFFVKASYLLEDVRRELRDMFAHDGEFGKLAFALEMHLEQREGA